MFASAIFAAVTTTSAVEPPPSWIRFELDVPIDLMREELERRVPRDSGATRHIALVEGYDFEIKAQRDPYAVSAHHDTLVVRTRVRHSLYVQGEGLKRAGCGTDAAPLTADVTVFARWGWNEDWGLEALTSAQGLVFAKRCKPDPPRINLIKRARTTLHEMFVDPLLQAAAEVAPSVASREFVNAVWDALAPGLLMADGWVDFAPDAVFMDPVGFNGDGLAIRGAVRVRPEFRTGRPVAAPTAFAVAAPTRVRLSGSDLGVTVHVAGDLGAARNRLQAALDSTFADEIRVESMTLHPSAAGVDVRIDLEGASTGRVGITAALEYEDHPPAIVAREPTWTEVTGQALASLDAARRERLARLLPIVAEATHIDLNASVAHVTHDLSANLQRRLGDGLLLAGALHDRRLLGVTAAGDSVSVALVLSGPAVIRPFAANP